MNNKEHSTMKSFMALVEVFAIFIYWVTQFIFLILQWCGVINWVWYYLCLPTIIVLGLFAIAYFIIVILLVIYSIILNRVEDKLSTTFVESLLSNTTEDDDDEDEEK